MPKRKPDKPKPQSPRAHLVSRMLSLDYGRIVATRMFDLNVDTQQLAEASSICPSTIEAIVSGQGKVFDDATAEICAALGCRPRLNAELMVREPLK